MLASRTRRGQVKGKPGARDTYGLLGSLGVLENVWMKTQTPARFRCLAGATGQATRKLCCLSSASTWTTGILRLCGKPASRKRRGHRSGGWVEQSTKKERLSCLRSLS